MRFGKSCAKLNKCYSEGVPNPEIVVTEEVDENDAPTNAVMKILIGIMVFVFVIIPLLAIGVVIGLIAIGQSLNSTFEEVEREIIETNQEQPAQKTP
mgnify:CR=1 FL=1